ncbi:MAG: CopD family protein, partial [Paracoccus sp. (in: a-proteobacteria)]|nr:CopD family protein [Paracoccus sp. (in: a-proteobacteria)]
MTGFLSIAYPYMKAFHIMAVISWMAALFYLPRLYVYHAERGQGEGEPAASLKIMEEKLVRVIMEPAMAASWIFGLALVLTPGVVS